MLVLQTAFPPDDRSVGYERGTSVSKAWDQATTDAALEVADYAAANLGELAGVNDGVSDRAPKLREFCRKFAERAFRRPLSDEQKAVYLDRPFKAAKNPDAAVRRTMLLVLMSPRFLYHELKGGLDAYDVACRISYGLWDSLPDQALLEAAAAGKLSTRDQIAAQAERMVADLRMRGKLREFLLQWLRVDRAAEVSKDPKAFPQFSPAVASDLRTSLDLFLEDAVWGESSDFRRLLLSDELYLNGRLASFTVPSCPPERRSRKSSWTEGSRRAAHASLPDGGLRVHSDELADPPGRVPVARGPGPHASRTTGGRGSPGPRSARRPDHPRAGGASDQPQVVPDVSRHDQLAGLHAREL